MCCQYEFELASYSFKTVRLYQDMYLAQLALHLFIPRHSNNHKARIIHPSSLSIVSLFLISAQILLRLTYFHMPAPATLGYAAQISPTEVIRLTNEKRTQAGLGVLTVNQKLTDAAKEKGDHMIANDYWSHNAPDGTEPWYFFTKHGYRYRYAGENLARDFSNPQSAIDAWMASPSHRENMLSSKYKEIGIAVVEGDLSGSDTTIIVQLFGTQISDSEQSVPIAKANVLISPTKVPLAIVLTPTPTSIPTPTPEEVEDVNIIMTTLEKPPTQLVTNTEEEGSIAKTLLSPFETTRGISIATLVILFVVTFLDWVIVAKRKVPRVSGRSFAHLAFFGMIIAVVLIVRAGTIL